MLDPREPRIDEDDAVADFDPDARTPELQRAIDDFEAAGWRPIDPADPAPTQWWIRQPPLHNTWPELVSDRGDRVADKRGRDVDRRFPAVRLVVHMNQSTFWWDTRDPCRVEDPGSPGAPITAEQAFELLGHSRVTIQPVLDLNSMAPVDGYEVRGRLRQTVVMKSAGACPFPYCDTFSRHQQCDHTINWPRGPSGVGNLAVADTTHHRVKTHSSWQVRQPFPGMYVWKDPYGQCYLVDHHGTRDVPLGEAA